MTKIGLAIAALAAFASLAMPVSAQSARAPTTETVQKCTESTWKQCTGQQKLTVAKGAGCDITGYDPEDVRAMGFQKLFSDLKCTAPKQTATNITDIRGNTLVIGGGGDQRDRRGHAGPPHSPRGAPRCPVGYSPETVKGRVICLPPEDTAWVPRRGEGVSTNCTPGDRKRVVRDGVAYHISCR